MAVAEGFPPSHFYKLHTRLTTTSYLPNPPHVKHSTEASVPSSSDERPSKRQKGSPKQAPEQAPEQAPKKRVRFAEVKWFH